MLDKLKTELTTIESDKKLEWLYAQDDKYGIMLKYAQDDEYDEIMDIIDWVFSEILKLK